EFRRKQEQARCECTAVASLAQPNTFSRKLETGHGITQRHYNFVNYPLAGYECRREFLSQIRTVPESACQHWKVLYNRRLVIPTDAAPAARTARLPLRIGSCSLRGLTRSAGICGCILR